MVTLDTNPKRRVKRIIGPPISRLSTGYLRASSITQRQGPTERARVFGMRPGADRVSACTNTLGRPPGRRRDAWVLISAADNPRATLTVVALGRTERLGECLKSLTAHRASTPFGMTCVIDPVSPCRSRRLHVERSSLASRTTSATHGSPSSRPNSISAGQVDDIGRRSTSSELIVWVEDEMVVSNQTAPSYRGTLSSFQWTFANICRSSDRELYSARG